MHKNMHSYIFIISNQLQNAPKLTNMQIPVQRAELITLSYVTEFSELRNISFY